MRLFQSLSLAFIATLYSAPMVACTGGGDKGGDADTDTDTDSDTDTDTDADVDTGDTAGALMYVAYVGSATVSGEVYDGTETWAFYQVINGGTALGDDLCLWTQDAQDWVTAGNEDEDPLADAYSSCEDCDFAFNIVLSGERDTSVAGDCGALGVDGPGDANYGYGFNAVYTYPGYDPFSALMFYSESQGAWFAVGFAELDGEDFTYEWPVGTYSY